MTLTARLETVKDPLGHRLWLNRRRDLKPPLNGEEGVQFVNDVLARLGMCVAQCPSMELAANEVLARIKIDKILSNDWSQLDIPSDIAGSI